MSGPMSGPMGGPGGFGPDPYGGPMSGPMGGRWVVLEVLDLILMVVR